MSTSTDDQHIIAAATPMNDDSANAKNSGEFKCTTDEIIAAVEIHHRQCGISCDKAAVA